MTTVQLRKKVHQFVDQADDRLLKMVFAMMNEYSSSEYEFSAEEKKIIYGRTKEYKSGKDKGISPAEAVKYAKSVLKK
ncbi:hypothetical protein BH09BAC5_BH09BAC5_22150 [soil metagenome]